MLTTLVILFFSLFYSRNSNYVQYSLCIFTENSFPEAFSNVSRIHLSIFSFLKYFQQKFDFCYRRVLEIWLFKRAQGIILWGIIQRLTRTKFSIWRDYSLNCQGRQRTNKHCVSYAPLMRTEEQFFVILLVISLLNNWAYCDNTEDHLN